MTHLLFALILFCLSTTSAFAAEESLFSLSATLRLFWGLLIVFGVLLIVYALAKKKLSLLNGGGKGAITVVEMRHLMPRKSICLIKVRNQEYLLGLGNDQIRLLAAIPPSQPAVTESPETKSFATTLQAATSDSHASTH